MDVHGLVVAILMSGGSMPHSVVLVYFVLKHSHHSHLHVRGYTLPPFLTVITTYLSSMLDYIALDSIVSYYSF